MMIRDIFVATAGGVIVLTVSGIISFFSDGIIVKQLGGVTNQDMIASAAEIRRELEKVRLDFERKVADSNTKTELGMEILSRDFDQLAFELHMEVETSIRGAKEDMHQMVHGTSTTMEDELSNINRILVDLTSGLAIQSNVISADTDPGTWIRMQDGSKLHSIPVRFSPPFAAMPNVVVAINSLEIISGEPGQYIHIEPRNVLPYSFQLHIRTSAGSRIPAVHVHWLAYAAQR